MTDVLNATLQFGQDYAGLLAGLSLLSVASLLFVAGIGARLITRLPPDYFLEEHSRPAANPLYRLVRNIAGGLLFTLGVAMLVLPGQGLLTMLAGALLADFPGKFRLARRLLQIPQLRSSVDWLRQRAGAAPLRLDESN